ncbi:DUF6502 family protein [Ramlibacter sp. Leaf400]|uniref:DUF6502 family protein n=1 Tax=Ramlibacter sp. Leaf400 TaxID=1736365 RepID=UPI000B2B2017|nr:DUF6502 family protein [Ramlibacter sp. Leaf400]
MPLRDPLHASGTATPLADGSPIAVAPLSGQPLIEACQAVLRPLARLAVGRGLPFAEVAELLKQSYVEAARDAHPGAAAGRAVSRISATTGLNRREVTRLMQKGQDGVTPARPSPPTQAFTRWLSDPALRDADGAPLVLPVNGPAPSFETLAQSVTRDVHPRTLLEELTRLGLARVDEGHRVHLVDRAFVPRADVDRMLAFLGANVGDHLRAAVENVLADGSRQFEQALFADELSQDSLAAVRTLVSAEWQRLLHAIAPALQALVDADKAAERRADQRVRIGFFAYTGPMSRPTDQQVPHRPTPSKEQQHEEDDLPD